MNNLPLPLCYRCEHRARYHETGHGPRCECGDTNSATCGCYMYAPVAPLVLRRSKGDRRRFGYRTQAVSVAATKQVSVAMSGSPKSKGPATWVRVAIPLGVDVTKIAEASQ
jgi:hypothetical protein